MSVGEGMRMFWQRSSKPETPSAEAASPPDSQLPAKTVQIEVESILRRCYEENAEVLLTLGSPPKVCSGRLHRVGSMTITVEVPRSELTHRLVAGHICGGVFHLGARSGGFLTAVRELLPCDEVSRLVLECPKAVMMVDARRSFRIPVVPEDGPEAQIEGASGRWSCAVSDLSRGGVGLKAREGIRFTPGDTLRVHLLHEQCSVTVEGLVARHMGEMLGVKFEVDEKPELLDQLMGLVASVERRWLRRQRQAVPRVVP